jgi:two-component system, LuxR family, sensor kinase FixL
MQARAIASHSPEPVLPVVRALAQLHELVALIDRTGRVAWASEGLVKLCGPRPLVGESWLERMVVPATPALGARLETTGRLCGEPVKLRGRGDRSLSARVSAARVSEETGDVCVLIFRLDDAQDAAHEFHHRLESLSAILEGAPDGVVVVDRSRFITWANPAMAKLTGYTVEELIDQPLVLFLRAQEDLERIAATLRPTKPAWTEELEVRRRDGQPLAVSVNARLLTLPDGTELGAVAYVRDVSERRLIENELSRRAEELQNWVNAVSHDLRSPLVAVLGFARLLSEDYGDRLDEQGLRFLRRIEEAGRTMEALVHDLLEFARIGRTEPRRVHVDPREVLLQLHAELKPRLEEAQIELSLPEQPPLVWCDRTQLYQVLSNLVGNALDHAGAMRRPMIEVSVTAEEGRRHLVVRDHGRGVDPADHDRIFEIFQTRGVRRNGKRGTGIGLAIVRKIAQSHGGAAWVESRLGEGAAFHVIFPNA